MERNPERCFDIHRNAVLCGWLELPFGDCLSGELVYLVVDAAEDADVGDRAVGVDYAIKDHGAAYVLPHQFQRIRRINFTGCYGCGEFGRRWFGRRWSVRSGIAMCRARSGSARRRTAGGCVGLESGEADDPTASGGVQVGHAEAEGVE